MCFLPAASYRRASQPREIKIILIAVGKSGQIDVFYSSFLGSWMGWLANGTTFDWLLREPFGFTCLANQLLVFFCFVHDCSPTKSYSSRHPSPVYGRAVYRLFGFPCLLALWARHNVLLVKVSQGVENICVFRTAPSSASSRSSSRGPHSAVWVWVWVGWGCSPDNESTEVR